MAIQHSVALRNARLDAITSVIGATAKLRIYSGSAPATCATAASGTLLAELPWSAALAAAASAGVLTLNNPPNQNAAAGGTAGYYRIYDSAGTTCHEQGTVGQGSGDLSLVNTVITAGQPVTITSWTKTEPGA